MIDRITVPRAAAGGLCKMVSIEKYHSRYIYIYIPVCMAVLGPGTTTTAWSEYVMYDTVQYTTAQKNPSLLGARTRREGSNSYLL